MEKPNFEAFRQFAQDFLAPELRGIKVSLDTQGAAICELRADMKMNLAEVRADLKTELAEVRADLRELRADMKTGFERLDRRIETYDDVQKLKVEMAELRGERRARSVESAA